MTLRFVKRKRGFLKFAAAPAGAIALALLSLPLAGCGNNLLWEYRDDPYIANISGQGTPEVMRSVNAPNPDERQMALRIIAAKAAEARRDGDTAEVDQLEMIIVRRYFAEKNPAVKACIVRICAPAVGRGSDRMVKFLRDRIAAGEFPGYAAMSLAALAPRDAALDIEPLTRHPDPGIRLQAASALTTLADERGYEAVARIWRGMEGNTYLWPRVVDGVPLAEARKSLAARGERAFGKPLE